MSTKPGELQCNANGALEVLDKRAQGESAIDVLSGFEVFRFEDGDFDLATLIDTAPVAGDDQFLTDDITAIDENILENDYDPDGGEVFITGANGHATDVWFDVESVGQRVGQAKVFANGDVNFFFDPGSEFEDLDEGFTDAVQLTYEISDATGRSAVGNILVTVNGLLNNLELLGDAGSDNLIGGNFNDQLFGFGGGDILKGLSGNDTLEGGSGSDRLVGGPGGDTLRGGDDIDVIDYSAATEGVSVDLSTGDGTAGEALGDVVSDIENIIGSDFADTLIGDAGANRLIDRAGNDVVSGEGGDDVIFGQDGDDTLFGGDGDDRFYGGLGSDSIDGGPGVDILDVRDASEGLSFNFVTGTGTGAWLSGDSISGVENFYGTAFDDTVTGNEDANLLIGNYGGDYLDGAGGDDNLLGMAGNDTVLGGAGNDYLDGAGGDDFLYGGEGDDDFQGKTGEDHIYGGDGADNVNGRAGDDVIYGGAGEDNLKGNEDADLVFGGLDDDIIIGQSGNDTLFGDEGRDRFYGGEGADSINGGMGVDILDYTASSEGVVISLLAETAAGGDASGDSFEQIEDVAGSNHADTLTGDAGANLINGNSGFDQLYGGDGADRVVGGDGDDTLFGDDGTDRLYGGARHDTLNGGAGDDTLEGGIGVDRFVFETGWGDDKVIDFDVDGNERIEFSSVSGLDSFDDLTITDDGIDTTISFGGDSILLLGVASAANVQSDEFLFN